ncbi:MAG: glycosyltransferase family 39 protein, partial [Clostridia bacterium]|nr:glycosyltransferase family 39 protein [Clostridia bacterium]
MTEYNKLCKYLIYIFLLLYLVLNSIFLTEFPFVHSDESWLSGLSRDILEKRTFSTTESFFDLYPRNPHAIKIFFHTIQATVIHTLGYTIFNMRFISLIFGVLTLLVFYKLIHQLFHSLWLSVISVVILALDIQFIYASHFARQEIILLFIFMTAITINMVHLDDLSLKHVMITGILMGISIGMHPNSFIIAIPFGLLYGYQFFFRKKTIKLPLLYIVLLSIFASAFIAISLSFNADYLSDYGSYGSDLGVTQSLFEKATQLKYYLLKLYYGISGTYYTPDIRFQFVLFLIAALAALYYCFKETHTHL